MKRFLLILWQCPQLVIGLSLCLFFKYWKTEKINGIDIEFRETKFKFCFSLGKYVFAPKCAQKFVLMHEAGHSVQSVYTGLFYLIIVGLPSVCLYLFKKLKKKDSVWYHSHYPENWADRISNIKLDTWK